MKILIIATGYPKREGDFNNIYLHRLAKSLVNLDVETHVIAPHAPGIKKNEILDGVHIHRFQYLFPATFQTLAYLPGIPEKIKTIRGKLQLLEFATNFAINKADKVVGISDKTCEAGIKISGRKDIEILPDGIDTETFNPKIKENGIKKGFGRFIFSSGRMVERKGFIYLIRAMPKVLERFPKIKLIISGDGPERKKLEKEVQKLKIKENIIFPGFISNRDFPRYMKTAEIFILPSIVDKHGDTEGSATILLEALACGTSIVGTKVGGVPYAIRNEFSKYLVKQKEPKELAEKIILLLSNEKLRKKVGRNGIKYVRENFGWEKIAARYTKNFKKLI